MVQERLLRFTAPALYSHMVEVFSNYHIHPHDVHAISTKNEIGLEVTLRFSNDFSEIESKQFSSEQADNPDDEVKRFFEEAAKKCKSLLIADYYKMIKL